MRGIMTNPPPIPAKDPNKPAMEPIPKALAASMAIDLSFTPDIFLVVGAVFLPDWDETRRHVVEGHGRC